MHRLLAGVQISRALIEVVLEHGRLLVTLWQRDTFALFRLFLEAFLALLNDEAKVDRVLLHVLIEGAQLSHGLYLFEVH